jgi:hypothetical protein
MHSCHSHMSILWICLIVLLCVFTLDDFILELQYENFQDRVFENTKQFPLQQEGKCPWPFPPILWNDRYTIACLSQINVLLRYNWVPSLLVCYTVQQQSPSLPAAEATTVEAAGAKLGHHRGHLHHSSPALVTAASKTAARPPVPSAKLSRCHDYLRWAGPSRWTLIELL